MKIQFKDLVNAVPSLKKVFGAPMKDAKIAYSCSKIQKVIDKNIDEINVGVNALRLKYGKEVNGITTVDDKNIEKFNKEVKSYFETELDIDIWLIPFKVTEYVDLSPSDFTNLELFMEKPNDRTINQPEK